MSEENVALIEGHLNALTQDGVDAWLTYFADDIDYGAVEDAPDYPGPIHDKDALRAYVEDWFDTFDDLSVEASELTEAGKDDVIAVVRVRGTAKLSGVETELAFAIIYTIRDAKIAQAREYWTRDEALEAAGLSE